MENYHIKYKKEGGKLFKPKHIIPYLKNLAYNIDF